MAANMNRRDFLRTTTGVTFAIGAGGIISACARDESAAPVANADPFNPNIWVTINPDNSIIVEYASTEMGQGSSTHTPMILAEYLDADWDDVIVHTVQVLSLIHI